MPRSRRASRRLAPGVRSRRRSRAHSRAPSSRRSPSRSTTYLPGPGTAAAAAPISEEGRQLVAQALLIRRSLVHPPHTRTRQDIARIREALDVVSAAARPLPAGTAQRCSSCPSVEAHTFTPRCRQIPAFRGASDAAMDCVAQAVRLTYAAPGDVLTAEGGTCSACDVRAHRHGRCARCRRVTPRLPRAGGAERVAVAARGGASTGGSHTGDRGAVSGDLH